MNTIALTMVFTLAIDAVSARDVHVDGYFRSNGKYVAPHVRSAPDGTRANNYGASSSGSGFGSFGTPTWSRDSDRDGLANRYDLDDDNDGIGDDDE